MIYKVTNSTAEIDFNPADETAEIIQNVRMILSTLQNSVPLFREFGINAENLDAPLNLATARLTAEIATQIAQYEPRAVLRSIDVDGDLNGKLKITAAIEV